MSEEEDTTTKTRDRFSKLAVTIVVMNTKEKGIKLKEDKLEVDLTEAPYFGHITSAEGLKSDPSKVRAVKDMQPAPQNKAELETILGMVNYLSKFAQNLSEITSPLRKLLIKDVHFAWDQPQE